MALHLRHRIRSASMTNATRFASALTFTCLKLFGCRSGDTTEPAQPRAKPQQADVAAPAPSATDAAVVIEDPKLEACRATLAKLSIDPRFVKPKKVTQPSQDEPHTTYEYKLEDIGDVIQWRTNDARWEILLAGEDSTDCFAKTADLEALDSKGPIDWWRITGGPFAGSFAMRSPGGASVKSWGSVCPEVRGGVLPLVARACLPKSTH